MKRLPKLSALVALCALGLLLGLGGGALHAVAAIADTGTNGGPVVPPKDNLYAASYAGHGVTQFSIGASGALHNEGFLFTGDRAPWNVAMTPDGRHLYVADFGGSDIAIFDVQDDGSLAQHDPARAQTAGAPRTVAVSPDGRNLYVADTADGGSIAQFTIGADGSLTSLGLVDTIGFDPSGIAVSPDGSSVYVTMEGNGNVEMFDRSFEDGTLAPKATEAVSAGDSGADPDSIVFTPDGTYAYVANYNESSIAAFKVGDGGVLAPVATYGSGYGVYQLAVSPDGLSLYAPAGCDNLGGQHCVGDVWEYTIDPESGELTTKTGQPLLLQHNASNMWLSADGTSAYVSTSDYPPVHNQIEQFDVASDGTLTPKAEASAPADPDPTGVIIPADQGPTASFTATPGDPGADTTFDATASSDADGTVAEYDWSFGDGTFGVDGGPAPTHTYASAGTYTVTLHVTDDAGCSTTTVFTGQSAYCNGTPAAEVSEQVVIGAGGTTSSTTTAGTTTAATTTAATTTASTSTDTLTVTAPTTTTIAPTTTDAAPPPPPPAQPSPQPAPPNAGLPPSPFGSLPLGQFAVARSAVMRHALWLDARAALPAGIVGELTSVQWNFGDLFDAKCGGQLTSTSVVLPKPGTYDVTLTVETIAGQVGQTTQPITVKAGEVFFDPRAPIFDCEDPGANAQPDRSDCVKSFSFGLVDVNSQGRYDDCFHIESRFNDNYIKEGIHHYGLTARALQHHDDITKIWVYHATINGPVLVNGLYVPVPESATTEYDSGTYEVGLGTRQLHFGTYKTVPVSLNLKVVPDKDGKFHIGDVDLSSAIEKIGGLKASAKVSLDFLYRQTRVTFHVGLPPIFTDPGSGSPPEATLAVDLKNGSGFTFDGGQLGPTDVFIGPLIVKKLQLGYSAYNDTWTGAAQVFLPGMPDGTPGIDAAPPPPDKGFGMKHGQFDHAGIGVVFPDLAQPMVFPGLFLKHIDVAIGVNPLRFTGSAGFDAAHIADIDGEVFVAFASPDDTYTIPDDAGDLAPLSGRVLSNFSIAIGGTVSVKLPVIDDHVALYNGYLLYEYPSLFEFAGGFNFDFYYLKVDGGLKGFLDGDSGKWSMEGGVHACLQHISILGIEIHPCDNVGGVISSKGIAFCTTVPIPTPPFGIPVPIDVGAGYTWDGALDVMIFSCDWGPWRETVPTAFRNLAVAFGPQKVALPDSLPAATIRLTGTTGAPDATITAPDGTTFSTSTMGTNPNVEIVKLDAQHMTYVAIKKPAGGTWTVTPAGSIPVTDVASSSALPAPHVRARVTGGGHNRVLRYRVTPASGRVVTFAERGGGVYRVIGTAHGSRGALAFRPAAGSAGRRQIVALVQEHGIQARQAVVAGYRAPGPLRPARPARLRVARHGLTLELRWTRVPNAVRYLTTLTVGGRVWQSVVTGHPAVRLGNVDGRERGIVSVRAISGDGRFGPPVRRRV